MIFLDNLEAIQKKTEKIQKNPEYEEKRRFHWIKRRDY
jgi:hypothetical protein